MTLWRYNEALKSYTNTYGVEEIHSLPHISSKVIGADTETSGLNEFKDRLLLTQISDGEDAYISDDPEIFRPILESDDYLKILQGGEFDFRFLGRRNIKIKRFYDTLNGERVLKMGRNLPASLPHLVYDYLGKSMSKEVRNSFIDHVGPFTHKEVGYSGYDVTVLPPIFRAQSELIKQDGLLDTLRLEFALTPVLLAMRQNGVGFSLDRWNAVREKTITNRDEKLLELLNFFPHIRRSSDLFGGVYVDFNPASSDQLAKALNKIGIKVEDVSERTLKQYLRDKPTHPFFRQLFAVLMEYRKLNSLSNLDLESHINPETGRIHGNILQLGARTGRMSMQDPNLQNQVSSDEVRACYVATLGSMIAGFDLQQIELVVMAELSQDPEMMSAVLAGEDLHTTAARLVFGVDKPTKAQRSIGKGTNFAAVFGSGPDTFSITAGITLEEAKHYLNTYFERFPRVRRYGDSEIAASLNRGYTINVGGRRRYIEDMEEARKGTYNSMFKNYPVQSTAADIIKRSLVNIFALKGNFKVILTVHDEILLEGEQGELEALAPRVQEQMTAAGAYYLHQLPVRSSKVIADCWKK